MQAHFTQFGRVESDPFRIPTFGDGKRGDGGFARHLDAALEPNAGEAPRAPVVEPPAADTPAETEAAPDLAATSATATPTPPPEPQQATPAPADTDGATSSAWAGVAAHPAEPAAATPKTTSANAAATAPETSDRTPQALPATAMVAGAPSADAGTGRVPVPVVVPAAAAAPAASTSSSLTSLAQEEMRSLRLARTSPTVGYRSVEKLALDRVEAARDSVLRQIVFKLQDGQSEARMQLVPPELGTLDVQFIVDAAGQTKLSMVAERPEIAELLQQNMPLLAASLGAQGLTVAQAEVKSRDGRPRGDSAFGSPRGATPRRSNFDASDEVSQARALVSSTGLDFWA